MIRSFRSHAFVILMAAMVSSNAHAFLGEGGDASFYVVVKDNLLPFGTSKDNIVEYLGAPSSSKENLSIWRFDNGLTFTAGFDETGLNDASLSSSQPLEDSYAVIFNSKVALSTYSVAEFENAYSRQRYCLSYYETKPASGKTADKKSKLKQFSTKNSELADTKKLANNQASPVDMKDLNDIVDGRSLGWLDLQLTDLQNLGTYAVFSAVNYSPLSLSTYEGQIEGKKSKVDSITISKQLQTFNTNIYCTP